MVSFFVKYGEKEHLQQIIDGQLRFTPSQTYIKIEETQHNKGQGDMLEGKMKIHFESAKLYHPETHELLGTLPKSNVLINIQDVSNMPIFCLSQYDDSYIQCCSNKKVINMDAEHIKKVKRDFSKATHALIILEPEVFINSVCDIPDKSFAYGEIKYFDYDINSLQMFMFLNTGGEELKTNEALSMTYENRYRHLMCKDIAFENQREYRFIETSTLIDSPIKYNFSFNSKYLLVSIDELERSVIIPD